MARGARGLTLSNVSLVDKALGRGLESIGALAEEIERAKVGTLHRGVAERVGAEVAPDV